MFSWCRCLFIQIFKPNRWISSLLTCLNTVRMYLIMQTFSWSLSFSVSKSPTFQIRSKCINTFHNLNFFQSLYTHIYLLYYLWIYSVSAVSGMCFQSTVYIRPEVCHSVATNWTYFMWQSQALSVDEPKSVTCGSDSIILWYETHSN